MASPSAVVAFEALFSELVAANGARKQLMATLARNEDELYAYQAAEADWSRAADIINSFDDEAGKRLKDDIERLVSHGLSSVFEEPMQFKVTSRLLRGAPSVEFTLISNGVERPILGSHGGGVAQVVGFVLRVVVVMLTPGLRPVLVLDEPFSQVSVGYRPRLADFIRELVDATPLQLILVTHDDHLPAVADVHHVFSAAAGIASVSSPSAPPAEA